MKELNCFFLDMCGSAMVENILGRLRCVNECRHATGDPGECGGLQITDFPTEAKRGNRADLQKVGGAGFGQAVSDRRLHLHLGDAAGEKWLPASEGND